MRKAERCISFPKTKNIFIIISIFSAATRRSRICRKLRHSRSSRRGGIRQRDTYPQAGRGRDVFSFIISQNNRIPRIQGIIERIAESLGEEREFLGERYFTFPNAARLAQKDESFYAALGAGYRAKYIAQTAERIAKEGLSPLAPLKGAKLRAKLAEYAGVGPKVADCIALFGFADTAAFPVDTWIEKAYREDMGGTLKKREEISAYFSEKFGEYGGFMQQYLFYYKRGRRE